MWSLESIAILTPGKLRLNVVAADPSDLELGLYRQVEIFDAARIRGTAGRPTLDPARR